VFPVSLRDETIALSVDLSETLQALPVVAVEYVYIVPEKLDEAKRWLQANRPRLIQPSSEAPQ
jgi:hypothetical protein